MNIYFSHLRDCNFKELFYDPIKDSEFAKENNIILPHDKNVDFLNVKDLIKDKKIDLIIAEVSYPSTGQGIELGRADDAGIRIICISRKNAKIANSLKLVCDEFLEYEDFSKSIEEIFSKLNADR